MKWIDTKRCRETGTFTTVFDADGYRQVPEEGFRWMVRCEQHKTEAFVERRREAHRLAAEPEAFCPECEA